MKHHIKKANEIVSYAGIALLGLIMSIEIVRAYASTAYIEETVRITEMSGTLP